jgi:16S rRNA (adenine1518-N6/adenine1519-N6)-dimethyltransferase
VGSTVVSLEFRGLQSLGPEEEQRFRCVVRAAFAHRRKTLVNSLRDEGYSSDTVGEALASIRVASTRRAETLSVDEFVALARTLR